MCPMISDLLKPAVTRIITPAAKGLLRVGLTPNAVTILGGFGVVLSAFVLYPTGHLLIGSCLIAFFVLSDLFDGTMARISKKDSNAWGNFLDSTVDRITDASILIALILGLDKVNDRLIPVILVALLSGLLVPYIRAKAESIGVKCSGGLAERTERIVIAILSIFLQSLGVPYALAIGMWLLALLGTFTVLQRIMIVKKALKS